MSVVLTVATTEKVEEEQPKDNDSNKQKSLTKMKLIALFFMLAAFIILVIGHVFSIEILIRMGEASLVGALADWFAVVALFRHPLGIPIPHTAIIPKNKDQIAGRLKEFLEEKFLQVEDIRKLLNENVDSVKIGALLEQYKEGGANTICMILKDIVAKDEFDAIKEDVQAYLKNIASKKNIAFYLGKGLENLMDQNAKYELTANIVDKIKHEYRTNWGIAINKYVENYFNSTDDTNSTNGWSWLKEKITTLGKKGAKMLDVDKDVIYKIKSIIEEKLEEAAKKDSDFNKKISEIISNLAARLQEDKEFQQYINEKIDKALANPTFQKFINENIESIREALEKDLNDSNSKTKSILINNIEKIAYKMQNKKQTIDFINNIINEHMPKIISKSVVPFALESIEQKIKDWDSKQISNELELQIGKDLQFIRINGTVIGAAAGCSIYGITLLVERIGF